MRYSWWRNKWRDPQMDSTPVNYAFTSKTTKTSWYTYLGLFTQPVMILIIECSELTGDAYSCGYLISSHLGLAYALLVETNTFPRRVEFFLTLHVEHTKVLSRFSYQWYCTWSRSGLQGVRDCPQCCSIVGTTLTVHQFFCILHCSYSTPWSNSVRISLTKLFNNIEVVPLCTHWV